MSAGPSLRHVPYRNTNGKLVLGNYLVVVVVVGKRVLPSLQYCRMITGIPVTAAGFEREVRSEIVIIISYYAVGGHIFTTKTDENGKREPDAYPYDLYTPAAVLGH